MNMHSIATTTSVPAAAMPQTFVSTFLGRRLARQEGWVGKRRPYLSIVVPCYNESECLETLYRRTGAICQQLLKPYELVLVNDGSTDSTWEMVVALAERDPQVVGVKLSRNFGQQCALSAGLAACRGERILILDADLQDPPELLPEMLRLMEEEQADVVYGQRRKREGETWLKRATAAAFYCVLNRLADRPIPRDTGDYRLLTRRVRDALLQMPEPSRFVRGMVSWIGFRQVPLLYDRPARLAGVTKWRMRQMIGLAADAVIGFSLRPLRLIACLGVACLLFFLLVSIVAIARWFASGDVGPNLVALLVGSLLGAIQLCGLSLVAEYVGRIYLQTLGRPLFLIDQILQCPKGPLKEDDYASA
jgi:glycosyltransferase involved in cell wall biosynthesis